MKEQQQPQTHRKRSDHLVGSPLVFLHVRYGDVKVCLEVEGTKGPVLPPIEHIGEVNATTYCFESGRGYNSTIGGLHLEEGPLLETSTDNLGKFNPVNYGSGERLSISIYTRDKASETGLQCNFSGCRHAELASGLFE